MVYTAGREGFEMLKWVVWVGCAKEKMKDNEIRKDKRQIVSRQGAKAQRKDERQ